MAGEFRLPLIPVFLAYTAGIYLGHFDLPFLSIGWILLAILLLLGAVLMGLRRPLWSSWTSPGIFFLLGVLSIQAYLHPRLPSHHVSRFNGSDRVVLEGTVDRAPRRTPNGTQLLIRSSKVIVANRQNPVEGYVLLFVKEEHEPFRLGDRYRFLCRLYAPRGFHNPGGFSYERHLAFERVHTVGFLSEGLGAVKLGEGVKNPLFLRMETWRDHIRSFLEREVPPPSSSILKALVLGERGDIPDEVSEQFIAAGVAHLLAISGDHLGIVALLSFTFILWVMKRSEHILLSISVKKWAAGMTIPCILLYTYIAGGGISVVRATLMVTVFFLSILFNRERNLLHTLAVAAFLILIASPPSLFDVSFQLSFLAVLSILYLVPRLLAREKREEPGSLSKPSCRGRLLRYFRLSLLVTAVASLGTAPFVGLHFNRISTVGFVSNLLMIPWVGFLIVPMALIASLLSFLVYPLAALLICIANYATAAMLHVVAFFASVPFASVFVSTPTVLEIVLFYLIILSAVFWKKGKRYRYLFLGFSVVFLFDVAFWNLKGCFQRDLVVTFIDVGQGDSILVEFPKGKRMLVDGGGLHDDRFDIGKNVIAPFLWKKKIRGIDYLVLTHPDPDHTRGLAFIASHFSIGEFWDNGVSSESDFYLRLREVLLRKKTKGSSLNETILPQTINGVRLSILNPSAAEGSGETDRGRSWMNNTSLVMKLEFKNIVILLTGDIEKVAEERILKHGHPVRANILKVPHHGSASSSSPDFVGSVNPTDAVFTVGERNIGRLPHPEVLKRYERLGTRIFRTDKHGAIAVVTDGERVDVRPFRRR
jgi:competence protein ComEC